MHYIFVDKTYSETQDHRGIVIAAWGTYQGIVNTHLPDLRLPGRASLLARIDTALERMNAHAFVGRADLSRSVFRTGEIDSCDDIPSMARADTIWSMATVFVVGGLIRDFCLEGQNVETVDIYFDPKSFKLPHRVAWEKTFRTLVANEAKRFAFQIGADNLSS